MLFVFVNVAAGFIAGIVPTIGTSGNSLRSLSIQVTVMVLQAITMILTCLEEETQSIV